MSCFHLCLVISWHFQVNRKLVVTQNPNPGIRQTMTPSTILSLNGTLPLQMAAIFDIV